MGETKESTLPQANNKNHFDYDTATALPHFLSGTNRARRKSSIGNDEIVYRCCKTFFGTLLNYYRSSEHIFSQQRRKQCMSVMTCDENTSRAKRNI